MDSAAELARELKQLSVLPGTEGADYEALPLSAIAQSRKESSFYPLESSNSFNGARTTRITLPLSGCDLIDSSTCYIEAVLTISAPGAIGGSGTGSPQSGGILLANSAESLISRLVVVSGSTELERVEFANYLESFQNALYMGNDAQKAVGAAYLYSSAQDIDTRFFPFSTTDGQLQKMGPVGATPTGILVQIPIRVSGLFGTNSKLLPVRFMAARRALQIQIYLEDAANVLAVIPGVDGGTTNYVAPTSAPTYALSQVRFVCDTLEMDATMSAWESELARGSIIPYPYTRMTNYQNTIPTGVSTFTWSISHVAQDITGVVFLFTGSGPTPTGVTPVGSTKAEMLASGCVLPSDALIVPANLQEAFIQLADRNVPLQPMLFQVITGETDTTVRTISCPGALHELVKFGAKNAAKSEFAISQQNFWRNQPLQCTTTAATSIAAFNTMVRQINNQTFGTSFADGCTQFALCFNFDANLASETAGTGLNAQYPSIQNINLRLKFSAAVPAYAGSSAATFGGPYTINAYVRDRSNVLISANDCSTTNALVSESSLGASF